MLIASYVKREIDGAENLLIVAPNSLTVRKPSGSTKEKAQ
jgi:hypothetical protein